MLKIIIIIIIIIIIKYVMELGHLLTRSGLTYPEDSWKVCHDSFCQSRSGVSLPWVIHCEAYMMLYNTKYVARTHAVNLNLNTAVLGTKNMEGESWLVQFHSQTPRRSRTPLLLYNITTAIFLISIYYWHEWYKLIFDDTNFILNLFVQHTYENEMNSYAVKYSPNCGWLH